MWSNETISFKTAARKPDNPPKTDIGGYHVDDNNHVFIYWKELNQSQENGPNASYTIQLHRGANS